MREEFVLAGVNGGPDIQAHCQVRDMTGILDYWVRGEHLQGNISFIPSWYPDTDSSPQDFLVAGIWFLLPRFDDIVALGAQPIGKPSAGTPIDEKLHAVFTLTASSRSWAMTA